MKWDRDACRELAAVFERLHRSSRSKLAQDNQEQKKISKQANLTRKMNIIKEHLKERKDRKLVELACTQLDRAWEQLIENHRAFQTLCDDDEDLQEADTWLNESQALVEELICRTVDYGEVKLHSGEIV